MGVSYKDYIDVDIEDPVLRAKVENALENFMRTPEGREVIEMGYLRCNANKDSPEKIRIEFNPQEGYKGQAFSSGRIAFGNGLNTMRYEGFDKEFHDFSLERVLFHELVHLGDDDETAGWAHYEGMTFDENGVPDIRKHMHEVLLPQAVRIYLDDPDMTGEEVDDFMKSLIDDSGQFTEQGQAQFDEVLKIFDRLLEKASLSEVTGEKGTERRTIDRTNEFMKKYYGEESRFGHKTDPSSPDYPNFSNGTPELESYPQMPFKP